MPLFVCENCKCIENTATGQYWSVGKGIFPPEYDKRLCSECASPIYIDGEKTGRNGKWHGKFPKMHIDEYAKDHNTDDIRK